MVNDRGADDPAIDSEPIAAGPQPEAAVVPHEPPDAAPSVLEPDRRALLSAILDRLIPREGGRAGAGESGVGDYVERTLAVSASLRRRILDGLVEVDLASNRSTGRGFEGLDPEMQDAVLRAVELTDPPWFAALISHAYRGYYTLARVHAAIGYESRPPQPLGHTLPPFDPSLLDLQRSREPFWRRTP